MNIVDSSGWIEYLVEGPNANVFAPPLEDVDNLLVPTISTYEVIKFVLRECNEHSALEVIALMSQGTLVDLTPELSFLAARISIDERLPMADSIILAAARAYEAVVWTQDEHFQGLEGVQYYPKTMT